MKKKYIISSIIICIVVVYLIFTGFKSEGVYYLNVDELIAKDVSLNKNVRVSGIVEKGTIKRIDAEKKLYFHLADEGNKYVNVFYKGIIPDAFKEEIGVIVEGSYNREKNLINADVLLAKCPSKYEAKIEKSNNKGGM
jgi:cytochrome c-type biogenesis protein CcmE